MTPLTTSLINSFIRDNGEDKLVSLLQSVQSSEKTLTIIADPTMHSIPSELIIGEDFVFSTGNIDTSSDDAVALYLEQRIKALVQKLKESRWNKVRLVYSGHALLPASIKMVVYRVCHLETEDIVYFGKAGYRSVSLDIRRLVSSSQEQDEGAY